MGPEDVGLQLRSWESPDEFSNSLAFVGGHDLHVGVVWVVWVKPLAGDNVGIVGRVG